MSDSLLTTTIERTIHIIRGQKILLDQDLARLYEVETRTLVQAVKRNPNRFPIDFMFQLTYQELMNLRSQSVISSSYGGRRYAPYAFTEQGVAMLSSVLTSDKAVKVNVQIMRAFFRLREILSTNKELKEKLEELEQKYDTQFRAVFDAIRELMKPQTTSTKKIGFRHKEE